MNEEAEVKETETTPVTSATQNGEAQEPVAEDTQGLDVEASQEEPETDEAPSSETDEQEAENHSDKEKSGSEYVKEAYECFLKDRPNDTEPLSVIRDFFDTNASDELKKKCAEEGKTVEGAYEFMCAVAQKGSGKSISDSVGLSICMHYFQDVPAMEDFEPVLKKAAQKRREEERQAKEADRKAREKDNPSRKEKRGKAKKSSAERNREIEDRIAKDIAKRESKLQKKGSSGAIKDQTPAAGKELAADGGEKVSYPSIAEIEKAGRKALKVMAERHPDDPEWNQKKHEEKPKRQTAEEIEKENGQEFLF